MLLVSLIEFHHEGTVVSVILRILRDLGGHLWGWWVVILFKAPWDAIFSFNWFPAATLVFTSCLVDSIEATVDFSGHFIAGSSISLGCGHLWNAGCINQ
jgi:hypothetical protein